MSNIAKSDFLKKAKRLEKVQKLMNSGESQTEIAAVLGVRPETIANDIKTLTVLSNGLLSPEVCAEKRIAIDTKLLELYEKSLDAYAMLLNDDPKSSATFFKVAVDIQKYMSKMWGLELSPSEVNPGPNTLSLTKVDNVEITISDERKKEITDAIRGGSGGEE